MCPLLWKVTVHRFGHKCFDTTFEGTIQEYLDGCIHPDSAYSGYKNNFPSVGNKHYWQLILRPEYAHLEEGTSPTVVTFEEIQDH